MGFKHILEAQCRTNNLSATLTWNHALTILFPKTSSPTSQTKAAKPLTEPIKDNLKKAKIKHRSESEENKPIR